MSKMKVRSHKLICLVVGLCTSCNLTHAQGGLSKVWVADLGNGMYKNPVLHADYSDPDAVRVGDDYYMTSSSFDAVPGLPILHSKDLVNWKLIGHALVRQPPYEHFSKTQHGNGVWAPAIRYHNNEFYIYYPDPDFGIYVTKAKDPVGPWSEPILVEGGKGLIDPCPLWDVDGKVYLVHAFAGSRAGIKSIIVVKELSDDGLRVVNKGKIVYDGHTLDPTIEGPKFYKRNGYYYIFAPAGGVSTGWQTVLRSTNVYGPYERKVVMDQGPTKINGPHQGAWVDTPSGENWFLHFQDKEAYGRVVHLQPMKWENDWPVIGLDKDKDGKGEPVLTFKKPKTDIGTNRMTPPESDEFNDHELGLQWQWQANPEASWNYLTVEGTLRLYSVLAPTGAKNLWDLPNLLMQKFPAEEFKVTAKIRFTPNVKIVGETSGLVIMGMSYAYIGVKSTTSGIKLVHASCLQADQGNTEIQKVIADVTTETVYFQVRVSEDAKCQLAFSLDGKRFTTVGETFTAQAGKWIGAKVGLFATRTETTNDAGYADVDWVRIEAVD